MIASLKLDGAESGGKGLGSEIPSPNTFSLAIKSPVNKKCERRPHFRSITESDPIICKNSFAPLESLSYAFEARDSDEIDDTGWIGCGATDTMTYDRKDFVEFYKTPKSHIQTANGGITPVEGAGTIEIFPNVQLSNCLYVPNLSQKLMSISHVTKDLNCTLLMQPTFCLL